MSDAAQTSDEVATSVHDSGQLESASESTRGSTHRSSSPPRLMNPVLWREARTRFESRRSAWVVLLYLVLVGGFVALVYTLMVNDSGGAPAITRLGETGRTVFETTVLTTALLILLLVPPQAASTITGERERQTLMPIQITLLRPIQIVFGKVGASVGFTILLITLTSPILALGYVIGGVTITNVLVSVAMLILIAMLTTTIAVWWSTVVRRSPTAIVMTMLTLFVMIAGSWMVYAAAYALGKPPEDGRSRSAPQFLLASNPIMALADAVGPSNLEVERDSFGNTAFQGPLTETKRALFSLSGNSFDNTIVINNGRAVIVIEADASEGPTTTAAGSVPTDASAIPTTTLLATPPNNPAASTTSIASATASATETSGPTTTAPIVVPGPGQIIDDNLMVDPSTLRPRGAWIPLWSQFLIFSALAMALAMWGAARRIRTPANTER